MFLDDMQCEFLDEALAIGRDGLPLATRVLLEIPRQNGKDEILVALELGDLFLASIPLIINTTHRYQTTMEHYLRVSSVIKECPDLDERVANYYTANGNCAIVLKDGCRLKFLARASGNARGFAGVRRLIFNEAMILGKSTMGDASPTGLTRRDRQTWLTSSPPRADSDALHEARRQVLEDAPEAKRTCAWLYENPAGTPVRLPDGSLNIDALAKVNPAFPERITVEAFEDALAEMGPEEFAVECLGVPEIPSETLNPIGLAAWDACLDAKSMPADPVVFAIEVSEDREYGSIVVAARSSSGGVHVEIVDARAGTEWIPGRARELQDKWAGSRFGICQGSPAWALEPDLVKAGVTLAPVSTGELAQACGSFADGVRDRTTKHRGDRGFAAALRCARSKPSGDAWVWSRSRSEGDISSIVAATVARWVHLSSSGKPVWSY